MFEFGRDLRKLFAQARESDDLSWLELVGVNLVEAEARQQSTDAGRVSCASPFHARARAAALWREHARRAGRAASLSRADEAADMALRHAAGDTQVAAATIERARVRLLRFDLCGDPAVLDDAARLLGDVGRPRKGSAATAAAAIHARLHARRARLSGSTAALMDAAALLDAAVHGLGAGPSDLLEDAQMDRAALSLECGVARRDPRLLDQAGRDLRALVEAASPDYRPLTRARALALCGAGLSALGALAENDEARRQGRLMFDAAAEQFTPDHSPLDWAAIQVLRAEDAATPLIRLAEAEALTEGSALVLGALARDARLARETAMIAADRDVDALKALAQRVRRRLEVRDAAAAPLDWVADQIGLARLSLVSARLTQTPSPDLGLILTEAAATAREMGVPGLADRAVALIAQRAETA